MVIQDLDTDMVIQDMDMDMVIRVMVMDMVILTSNISQQSMNKSLVL